ncbi:hypothetical protein [Microvirga lotononidis]|uniref:Protease inhibitor Inh n=1 Tax=Microvirga lotononidis TaxID=864069 RepID=I4YN17_9HYPH|nr:hypothetical protein [Microvirga lotononidis]EIM25359.1 hypothetical protein MicloDRAFT_00060850 [Microvirga lotononidis]WQO27341.1 hypothetical protein U0023_22300 [Microvirga lotononidis]
MTASTRTMGSLLLAAVLLGGTGSPAGAASLSELQGAWVINSAQCSDVFTKRSGRFAFRPGKRNADTSFIINGSRIQGARATCTLASEKQTADGLKAVLDCSSRMMVGALPVTFRTPGPNTIVKFDPDFPDLTATFTRCN